MTTLERALERARAAASPHHVGSVTATSGLSLQVTGVRAVRGDLLHVDTGDAELPVEVVSANGNALNCMPLAHAAGLGVGQRARRDVVGTRVPVGAGLRGRVLDGLGNPIDGLGPLIGAAFVDADADPPNPLRRRRVDTPLGLGVRALDTMTPAGQGQRFGLFAGSGVGKSSLLSMIARGSAADITVLCLVGERGREVREFLEDDLGPEGLARSVVVVSTSDQPAIVRLRAAQTATRIAESFRDEGHNVVLMMDSLTRFAMAGREIGLATGEPPATRGYPPSVFASLARLLERAGPGERGTITGIYTVLVDGDDHDEPIADAARSILDGHVVLSRKLATAGHFPSIDVLDSVSRVATKVTTPDQRAAVSLLRQMLAAKREVQDLIGVGAYSAGSNPMVDAAITYEAEINAFLRQDVHTQTPTAQAWEMLFALVTQAATGGGDDGS